MKPQGPCTTTPSKPFWPSEEIQVKIKVIPHCRAWIEGSTLWRCFFIFSFLRSPGGEIKQFKLRRTVIGPIWEEMGGRRTGRGPEIPPLCYLLWHLEWIYQSYLTRGFGPTLWNASGYHSQGKLAHAVSLSCQGIKGLFLHQRLWFPVVHFLWPSPGIGLQLLSSYPFTTLLWRLALL